MCPQDVIVHFRIQPLKNRGTITVFVISLATSIFSRKDPMKMGIGICYSACKMSESICAQRHFYFYFLDGVTVFALIEIFFASVSFTSVGAPTSVALMLLCQLGSQASKPVCRTALLSLPSYFPWDFFRPKYRSNTAVTFSLLVWSKWPQLFILTIYT